MLYYLLTFSICFQKQHRELNRLFLHILYWKFPSEKGPIVQWEMEEKKESAEKNAKKMKQIICAIVLLILFMLGCMMAMGVAAVKGLHGGNTKGPSSYLPIGTIVSEAKHAAACESG